MEQQGDLIGFDFKGWINQNGMGWEYAAKVFNVSRRTVAYWSKECRISGPALQLVRSIERDSLPWSKATGRGLGSICSQMAFPWRQEIFGGRASDGDYRTWLYHESPDAKSRTRRHAAVCQQMQQRRDAAKDAASRARCRRRRQRRPPNGPVLQPERAAQLAQQNKPGDAGHHEHD